MSHFWAPIALRIPISLVRSVTETNIIFIMPIPPTIKLTIAIPARRIVNVLLVSLTVDKMSDCDIILKSSSSGFLILCRSRRIEVISLDAWLISCWDLASILITET